MLRKNENNREEILWAIWLVVAQESNETGFDDAEKVEGLDRQLQRIEARLREAANKSLSAVNSAPPGSPKNNG